jgi:hypothetical protein
MNNDVSPTEQPTYLESQLAKEIMFWKMVLKG